MNLTTNYGVIIINAGPSDIFYAYELIQRKPDMKVLMVGEGRPIEERTYPKRTAKTCVNCKSYFITTGFADAGAFSDDRLSLSPDVGGNFPEILGYDGTVELLKKSDNTYLKFDTDTNVYGMGKQKKVEEIHRRAIGTNLKLVGCPIQHLGTEEGYRIHTQLQERLLAQGTTMGFNTMVRDITIKGDTVKGIITDKDKTYHAPKVVSVIKREDSDWLSYICGGHGVQTQVGTMDVGMHVEARDEVMKSLNESLYEAKLIYYTPIFNDKVRTLCTSPSRKVATEYYESSLAMVSGHAHKSQEYKTNDTNSASLVGKNFTKPFSGPIGYNRHIARLSNMPCGGRIMVQTLGDFQREHRTTEERLYRNNLVPTLKGTVLDDLSLILPHRIMTGTKKMLLALGKVTPDIISDEILLYGVEVKFCSNKVVVNADSETSIKGSWAVGDGISIIKRLQQASADGISVARNILKQMETL